MRGAVGVLLFIAGLYLAISIFSFVFMDTLIFSPPKGTGEVAGTVHVRAGNTDIELLYLPVDAAGHAVLFSHGNGEDLSLILPFLKEYNRAGYSVVAYDYPGYGGSGGKPSEEGAYRSAEAVYDYMISDLKLQPSSIIAHGRSLGGAVAIELATRRQLAGIIVESSFTAPSRIFTGVSVFPDRKYNSIGKLGMLKCPVMIIHGKDDAVVPFACGEELYRRLRTEKRCFWVTGAGHNDLLQTAGSDYWEAIGSFMRSLPELK